MESLSAIQWVKALKALAPKTRMMMTPPEFPNNALNVGTQYRSKGIVVQYLMFRCREDLIFP